MKVMIVDDHKVNRMLPIAHHTRLGVETVQCADGHAALDRLAEDGFDAVLLDVSMPGQSGLDARPRVGRLSRTGRHDGGPKAVRPVPDQGHRRPRGASN
jgi:CheY-like chemotaxis protein